MIAWLRLLIARMNRANRRLVAKQWNTEVRLLGQFMATHSPSLDEKR